MKPTLELAPHPLAPAFEGEDGVSLLYKLIDEFTAGRLDLEEPSVRLLVAQAGLVSLWFFLKFIVGYSISPFDLLNADLHIDMCNVRQRALAPGARVAFFLPRFAFKSTIVTEGGALWEAVRDPMIAMCVYNAKAEKAKEFFQTVKVVMETNAFFQYLYSNRDARDPWGACVPVNVKNTSRWNETEIVFANRPRWQREATLTFAGVGGASEGGHFDLLLVDDMIGLKGLNATQDVNAVMEKTRNWFWSSEKTLLRNMATSRVLVPGTRYASDDIYDDIIQRAKVNLGYPIRDFESKAEGKWTVYYRKAIEDGKIILPERYTEEGLRELAENDWWTYVTQFLNEPGASGLAELIDFPLKQVSMEYEDDAMQWFVCLEKGDEVEKVPLSSCDVVIAVDPAASEKRLSAKTSRSAVGAIATDAQHRRFLIDLRVGYAKITTVFDWMFKMKERFSRYVRSTLLESNAGFKALGSVLKEEEMRRGIFLNLRPFPALGDKVTRIRTALLPELESGRLYVCGAFFAEVEEERRGFPNARRMDVLDMFATGVGASIVPDDEDVVWAKREEEDEWENRVVGAAGY